MFAPELFLDRIAAKLRSEIGPTITDDYARTQAFMAAVILERVSRQITYGVDSESAELEQLHQELVADLANDAELSTALQSMTDDDGLCALIEALYGASDRLGEDRFESVMGKIRAMLRTRLDRDVLIAEGKKS